MINDRHCDHGLTPVDTLYQPPVLPLYQHKEQAVMLDDEPQQTPNHQYHV